MILNLFVTFLSSWKMHLFANNKKFWGGTCQLILLAIFSEPEASDNDGLTITYAHNFFCI